MLETKIQLVEPEPDIEQLAAYDPAYSRMAKNLFFQSSQQSGGIMRHAKLMTWESIKNTNALPQ